MQEASVAHPTPEAIKQRHTRGLMLYNRERERIHELYANVWAVPSSQGGFWRVNLNDATCGCQDFRYQCVDEAGEPVMRCKHVVAATIARAKQECSYCLGSGYHFIGSIDADGEEVIEAYACRRCQEALVGGAL